jgi:hypothetical protein
MGEVLERPGRRAEVKVSRDELVVFEFELEPETDGTGPHFHKQHVDSFYVLESELEVRSRMSGCASSTCTRRAFACDEYIRKLDAGEQPDPEQYDGFAVLRHAG